MNHSSDDVQSVLVYSSETWAMIDGEDDIKRLERAENILLRWMCDVTLTDGIWTAELIDCLGFVSVEKVVSRGRLGWYGNVERKYKCD